MALHQSHLPQHHSAQRLGYLAATLCGLLVLAMLVALVMAFSQKGSPSGEIGAALLLGTMLGYIIPLAAIPVTVMCVWGMTVSHRAMRSAPSPEARTGWLLSLGGLMSMGVCYALCFALVMIAR
jgi:hypothetical protein